MLSKIILGGLLFFGALPTTTNYSLNSYGFGSGGTPGSTTSNYAVEGVSGELSGPSITTANYSAKPGFIETQQAHVPKIATFDNGSATFYNKLHFVIDQQGNPSDATYALSISTDNFSSDIRYVKADLTVGTTLNTSDYLTYASLGGASGSNIIGLLPNTTYYLKAKATQSKYTESAYGPAVSVSTVGPQLSFSISTSSVSLGNLLPNTVISAPSAIDLTFATNASAGGDIFINGQNGGLFSTSTSTTITSATGDLSSLSSGFGAQVTAAGQSSGGPLSIVSPYDGSGNNVGIVSSVIRKMVTTTNPVAGGTSSVLIKAKSASNTQSANDYQDIVTLLASAAF